MRIPCLMCFVVAAVNGWSAAETPPVVLPELAPLRFDLTQPGVRITFPAGGNYPAIARRFAADLAAATGSVPELVPENELSTRTGRVPVIVLGNLNDSAVVRRLYFAAYDFTDYAFPGPGGYAVRTIRDPLELGSDVILLGGSDEAGVAAAGAQLVKRVREHGPVLGYVNDVQLGSWTTAAQLSVARFLADDDAVWQRVGQSGSWDYMDNIARAGTGFLRTGNERYLQLFRRELDRFIDRDVFNPNPEAMQMLHGRLYVLLVVWDLVRDHPLFSAEERRKVDAMFLHVTRSPEGTEQIAAVAATTMVRYNHHTRAGLDAFFVGRYFDRRFHLAEAKSWLALAEKLFAPQLTSAKPVEDSWGHQWAASLFNTLAYALATGRETYVKSPAFRQAADRALISYGRAPPRHYLSACAAATGDTGYLSLEADLPSLARDAAQLRLVPPGETELVTFTDEVLRTFTTSRPIVRRTDLLGLGLAPLDPLWHDTIETPTYNPGGIFAVTVPAADAFDKAALRDGWAPEDFYLLLDGISGGHHAYQDANCLVWLREGGVDWFTPQTGYQHSLGVRWQNGVNVALDGRGPEKLHRYARLLYHGTDGEFSAIGTALDGVGALTWERHLLRRRGAWTLVIDRVVSAAAGELLVERSWFPNGECVTGTDRFTSRQAFADGERFLHLASTIEAHGGSAAGSRPVERARLRIAAGGSFGMAGLLWTTALREADKYAVGEIPDGWRVSTSAGAHLEVRLLKRGVEIQDGERAHIIGATDRIATAAAMVPAPLALQPTASTAKLSWIETKIPGQQVTAVAGAGDTIVVGTAGGAVANLDERLNERWKIQSPEPVLSLEVSGRDVVVGGERGGLSLLDETGRVKWQHGIPWVTLPWAYWGEERSRIRELAVADLDGSGVDAILASNADRRVYAFDRTGRELWKRPIEWGVYTAMWPGAVAGKFALAGGTSRPSIHGWTVLLGADGAVSGHRQRPDLTSWSLPANTRDLQWVDLDGDGAKEIVAALDTNCRQLVAYTAAGEWKWDLDVAGAAEAISFDAARRRVIAASSSGYVVGVDGATGRRLWLAWIGDAANLVWSLADGRTLAVTPAGRIWVISSDGEVTGKCDLGSPIVAIPRPGNHRAADRPLILATADGQIRMLTEKGGGNR